METLQTLNYETFEKVIFNILDNYYKDKEQGQIADISFNQLCENFFDKAQRDKKLSTLSTYQSIFNCHIKSSNLGGTTLVNLSNAVFDNFVNELLQKLLSAKRVVDIIVFIKSILNFAKAENLMRDIDFNIVRPKIQKREIRVLSVVEQTKLETYLYNHTNDSTCLAVLISLSTGMRIGELCALKWSDIDLNNGIIKIRRTIQRIKNTSGQGTKTILHSDTPKSPSSSRDIPLNSSLFAILKALYKPNLSDFYILTRTNTPTEPRALQYAFKALLNVVGIADANFHSLRHSFATRAIECDMDIKTLSELLGHSSVKITLDKYVHSSIQQKLKQLEKMSAA